MKTIQILLSGCILICLTSCVKNKTTINYPPAIDTVVAELKSSFGLLNTDMAATASYVAANQTDTAVIRAKLAGLYSRSSFSYEFVFVTSQGIMQLIEPPASRSQQGADISQQDHVKQAFKSQQPVLSKIFFAVEGFYAAVDIHPVVANGQIKGGIANLFLPNVILKTVIAPVIKGQPFDIFVMEKGGRVLYDTDSLDIGDNLFTDPDLTSFPELTAAARLWDAQQSGETGYKFYLTGTSTVISKKAFWKTFELYGTEWRIIWIKPE
jgi:hypothetical protein